MTKEQAYRFERAAASHLLCSGRFEEGEALLQKVLARLHLEPPASQVGLLAALAWEHTRVALRGLDFKTRARSDVSFDAIYAAELCGMLSMETVTYDPVRAALFQARCLRMALELGWPEGVARALCAAATMLSVSESERARRRAEQLLARAEAIATTAVSALLYTNIASSHAICAFLTGRIADSVELCQRAEQLHRTSAVDSEYHHRFTITAARICALLQLGRYPSAEVELQAYLKEAAATQNVHAELLIAMSHAWCDVIAGRAEQSIKRLDQQRVQLPRRSFGLLHVLHMIAVLEIVCATGEYAWALRNTDEYWRAFTHSVVRESGVFTLFAYEVHARLSLNRAARDGHGRDAKRQVALHTRALRRLPRSDAEAVLARIEARIAILVGHRAEARHRLEVSCASFDAHGAHVQAARNRHALGTLEGGERGQAMQREALASLSQLGVASPLRDVGNHFPELLPNILAGSDA